MSEDFSAMFASMTASFHRMEEKIAGVVKDMEYLKNPQRAAWDWELWCGTQYSADTKGLAASSNS